MKKFFISCLVLSAIFISLPLYSAEFIVADSESIELILQNSPRLLTKLVAKTYATGKVAVIKKISVNLFTTVKGYYPTYNLVIKILGYDKDTDLQIPYFTANEEVDGLIYQKILKKLKKN